MQIRRTMAWLGIAPVLALCPGALWARDYYVSPGGSDAASGMRAAPFATVGKAASVLEPGDTCWLRGGTYRETVVPLDPWRPGATISERDLAK